jgi:single-strand DNA-binding protein
MLNNNHVTLAGRLTRPPESTQVGETTVVKFAVANNRRYRDNQGEWHDQVLFMDCEAWGHKGDQLLRDADKGSEVVLEGSLKQETWTGRDGRRNSRILLRVEKVGVAQTTVSPPPPFNEAASAPS